MNAAFEKLVQKDDGRSRQEHEIPVPRRHHIGHYLPAEDEALFNPNGPKRSREDPHRLGESNKGHAMMKAMGWTEGAGLGKNATGIVAPIKAEKRLDKAGIGMETAGAVAPTDDAFDLYKKRMQTAYKHRPNPMNNPRKQYY